jgi:flavin reductase (DIM6/NTAB) family NADH-FMN oxidoreductase RutF
MQSPPVAFDRSTGGNTRGSVRVAVGGGGYDERVDTAKTFHKLVGGLEYPMFIVTARAGDEPLGCLVGFATQTSIDPPRFAVCLSHNNRTYRQGRDSELLGVHCVPEHAGELAELFGGETADEVDKFARAAWREGPGGVPLLDECPNRFVGRVLWRHDGGDHDVFLLEPVAAEKGTGEDEFTFHRAKRIEAGHEA